MSLIGSIIGAILRPVLERQVKNRSLDDLVTSLQRSGEEVTARLDATSDTLHNREIANHIVGIERWGQRRLRTVFGEPFTLDSYRGYRLHEDATLANLRSAYASTRQKTLELVQELAAKKIDPTTKVRHNDLGELSVKGWLAYLDGHAKRESTRLKT